jgi:hypothetical protein
LIVPRVRSTHTVESVQLTLLIHSGETKTFLPATNSACRRCSRRDGTNIEVKLIKGNQKTSAQRGAPVCTWVTQEKFAGAFVHT